MRTLLLTVLLVGACGDSGSSDDMPASPEPAPVETKAIPLIDWVDDLLDHHTDDVSTPDTVDDKKIIDDEDPNIFNRRF